MKISNYNVFIERLFSNLAKILGSIYENSMFDFGDNKLMSKSYRYISSTIPKLKTLEGKIIKPYLYIIENKNINHNLKIKSDYDLIFIKGKI